MTTLSKRRTLIALAAAVGLAAAGVAPAFAEAAPTATQSASIASPSPSPSAGDGRPVYHYAPAQHWMNDPNGLIYTGGKYHLFYQYNPLGNTGGNASWGHAVSTDLAHWTELPIAIPMDATEEVWSGSVVNDESNTSGLGTGGHGPLVAVYTSAVKATGVQRQSIAYSNDSGTTWTKYSGNPVIDIGSHNFRDPKVFWYAPAHEWRMIVALSDQHKAAIYGSPDLKSWTELSEFGPDGVASAVWECPDLFPMQLDGKKDQTKWVLTVNVAGKAEYFVGDFDGKTFTNSEGAYTPPTGSVLNDFEGATYGAGWTTTGTAFGDGPARDTGVTGAIGTGYIDTFHGADAETGTLTSPTFTIDKGYLNFLIAGGNHPYVPGGSTAPPAGEVFQDFEGTSLPGWTGTGAFAGIAPSHETLSGQVGTGVLDTFGSGDASTGTITSPSFTVTHPYIDLLTAGGNHPWGQANPTSVNLVVNGQVVDSVTGNGTPNMDWVHLDASKYVGQQASLQVVDDNDGSTGWGHFMVDEIVFADTIAQPWNTETGVNLLVGGQVVRSATGNDGGGLDWASWDVRDLQGAQAQLQFVDLNTGGWGHLIADEPTLADVPAQSAVQRAHWLDNGHDFYAAVTYNDAPKGQRIAIGWVNNWDYANAIPTSPWRGQQSAPRILSLQTVDGKPRIVQTVAPGIDALAVNRDAQRAKSGPIAGTRALGIGTTTGSARVDAVLTPGTADTFGLQLLRSADGTQSVDLKYDTRTSTLSLDRTHSGNTGFNPAFPVVDSARVALDKGQLNLRIYVDANSIEVFAQDGRVAMTQLVFPDVRSTGIATTATGGTAQLSQLTVTPLAR
ncbi:glycoside hydrolase family 32 protein [Microbacterium rhizosphaerae]|uniref:GH32 C-terminal domain-containing protein n=1 Tax=Microbacterium rhizosphaerae TaxID=1678237 RepID=A0ABZ0SP81_9MICO|nr:GH32 C-terminal domain-containing protein [Microbacterium rhizosphaerae]WPR89447.1 GH32 C-terminal domain-containing protein [Microbacterium rhizosphaerae]